MKLYCSKILLFFLTLNILLTSYHAHNNNKNKLYNTPHHTQTNRSLCEGDTQSLNYDNDPQMKKVMKKFQDRTSERLREYDERMKEKRQKHKEERNKNIQKIIEEDKREKSLAEKIEKGCLKCGCALGGGVLPVWGLVSGLWYATLSQHATKLALQEGIKKGLQVGLVEIKNIFRKTYVSSAVPEISVDQMLSSEKFTNGVDLYDMVKYINTMSDKFSQETYTPFFSRIGGMVKEESIDMFYKENSTNIAAVANAFEDAKAAEFALHTSSLSNTIIASVVAIVVIVLIMVIIYLILRYRRKKKNEEKSRIHKIVKSINIWFHNIDFNLMFCE
ncbi:rifin PIR protein,putative [Plasmodium sp. DRC-Itaito]|nr:rifin PIR protein,putative [Plasmodium sp. DRC-Itaito]